MASQKAVVEAYIDGFRRGDHEAILACLADDVFTFTGDRISRLETFHINLGGAGDALFDARPG